MPILLLRERGFLSDQRRKVATYGVIYLTETKEQKKPRTAGSTLMQTARLVIMNFFSHDVGRSGAALAYHLLFALFPLLIFISNLLGQLDLNVASITEALMPILPRDIVDLLGTYLEYVSQTSSQVLLWFSLVFTIYFPMRAAKGLMDDVRLAYQLPKPKHPIAYAIRQLVYTLVLLVVITLTLLLSTMGERVLSYLFPVVDTLAIPDSLIKAWHYLRFLLVGIIMFAALAALYAMSQDQRQPLSGILPGAAAALIAWLAVSIGFSFYVENFANYSVIYGTLGAVIVLLIWLYMTAVILILGAELNAALQTIRSEKDGAVMQNDSLQQ